MTKSVKIVIVIIGVLSIIASIYLAYSGYKLIEYVPGFMIGITLLGSAYYSSKHNNQTKR